MRETFDRVDIRPSESLTFDSAEPFVESSRFPLQTEDLDTPFMGPEFSPDGQIRMSRAKNEAGRNTRHYESRRRASHQGE